ncbi:BACON domain-containing protein [uncultured Kordia sp.]|uniref:BACON domain-containing protein n=1 Tax=uncultured Kordia sp. TaxID=507699 RepID=UPI0026263B9B|nr:BACON domain-containing protein [uncultured Kordia sp.]
MKIAKQIFLISINTLILLFISSCSKEETEIEIESYFEITETQLFSPPEETEFEIDISTNTDWKIISNPDWLEVVKEVDYNINRLHITVFENEDYSSREGKIKIKTTGDIYEVEVRQGAFYEDFRKGYINYDPVGYQGNAVFTVFTQSEAKPDYYWGFTIRHEQNLSDDVYVDQFRITYCEEFRYNGEEMIPTEITLLHFGESEFTYRKNGASNFTGGFHGNETLEEIEFFIDNTVMTDLSTAFAMKPCEEFSYKQKSMMHKDDMSHGEEAEHIKQTTIKDGGYTTKNTLIGKENISLSTCYGSLVSVSIDIGQNGYTDNFDESVTFNQNGDRKMEEVNNKIFLWSETNQLSTKIESIFSINDNSSKQYIWDTQYYSKYYRYLQNVDLAIGETWDFETKVTFNKMR